MGKSWDTQSERRASAVEEGGGVFSSGADRRLRAGRGRSSDVRRDNPTDGDIGTPVRRVLTGMLGISTRGGKQHEVLATEHD
jgi:hypothetical protein